MDGLGDYIAQARFVDVDFTFVQSIDDILVDVHAQNFEAVDGEGGGGRQSDIAKTNEANLLKVHLCSLWSDMLRAIQL